MDTPNFTKNEIRNKYKELFDYSLNLIYVIDLNGNIIDANDITLKKLGYKREEIPNISFNELIDKSNILNIFNGMQEIKENGKNSKSFEYKIKTKDGKFIYLETYGIPIKKNDSICGFLGIANDITAYKIMEKNTKDSEEMYRLISENANDMIAIVNDKFEYVYINEESSYRFMGYKNDEILGRSPLKFIHPDDIPIIAKILNKGFLKGYVGAEYRFKHKKGNWVWLESRGKIFTDREGKLKGLIISRDISERKATEQKLRESEKKYRNILENIKEGYFEVDLRGTFIFANDHLYNAWGYTKDELLNRSYKLFMNEQEAKKIFKVYNEVYTSEKDNPYFEYEIIRKNGEKIIIESSIYLKRNDQEDKVGFFGLTRDITEKKIAEYRLIESEKKYRRLYEASPNSITLVDNNGFILDTNPASENIYGFRKEEVIGRKYADLGIYTSEQISIFENQYIDMLEGKEVKPVEIKIKKKDGNIAWINYQNSIIKKDDKIFIEAIVQDITENKNMELKLKESEEKYRLISENANDMIAILNEKFEFEYINETITKRFMGYVNEDVIGKSAMSLIHPDDFKESVNLLKKYFEIGDGMGEVRYKKKDGEYVWLEVRGRTFLDKNGQKKALLISRDITQRKEAERLFEEERVKLKELDGLKIKLTAKLSEELESPISEIFEATKFLLDSYKDKLDKKATDLLELIRRGGEKSRNMVERILDITRMESESFKLSKKKVRIIEILKKALKEVSKYIQQRDINLKINSLEDVYAEVDEIRIVQVISYIISNSIKNSPFKGEIVITLKSSENYAVLIINSKKFEFNTEALPFEYKYLNEIISLHQGSIIIKPKTENNTVDIIIRFPSIAWEKPLIHLYVIYKSGILLFEHSFSYEPGIFDSLIISGGLIGTMYILKEIVKGEKQIKTIDHGDRKIMFEINKTGDIIFALIVKEENFMIRNKLNAMIKDFEYKYEEKIKDIKNSSMFSYYWIKIEDLVKKYLI